MAHTLFTHKNTASEVLIIIRFFGDYNLRMIDVSYTLSLGQGLLSLGTVNLCGLAFSEVSGPAKPPHHLT